MCIETGYFLRWMTRGFFPVSFKSSFGFDDDLHHTFWFLSACCRHSSLLRRRNWSKLTENKPQQRERERERERVFVCLLGKERLQRLHQKKYNPHPPPLPP